MVSTPSLITNISFQSFISFKNVAFCYEFLQNIALQTKHFLESINRNEYNDIKIRRLEPAVQTFGKIRD